MGDMPQYQCQCSRIRTVSYSKWFSNFLPCRGSLTISRPTIVWVDGLEMADKTRAH